MCKWASPENLSKFWGVAFASALSDWSLSSISLLVGYKKWVSEYRRKIIPCTGWRSKASKTVVFMVMGGAGMGRQAVCGKCALPASILSPPRVYSRCVCSRGNREEPVLYAVCCTWRVKWNSSHQIPKMWCSLMCLVLAQSVVSVRVGWVKPWQDSVYFI